MSRFISCFLFTVVFGLSTPSFATDNIRVFTCEPEWQALVKEIGGNKVATYSATTALQDPHHIEARPSLISQIRRADLLICTGAELEIGWLPVLLRQSGNPRIQKGKPGFFMASDYVRKIEIPKELDNKHGHVHAAGNPHVHLNPKNILTIAKALSKRLQQIDKSNTDYYQGLLEEFNHQWLANIKKWQQDSRLLKGKQAIVYHKNWSYLLKWIGIRTLGDLEPKPGLPPTTSHLVSLIKVAQEFNANFILVATYQNDRGAEWLSKKTGVPVLKLPFSVGSTPDTERLSGLFDVLIKALSQGST